MPQVAGRTCVYINCRRAQAEQSRAERRATHAINCKADRTNAFTENETLFKFACQNHVVPCGIHGLVVPFAFRFGPCIFAFNCFDYRLFIIVYVRFSCLPGLSRGLGNPRNLLDVVIHNMPPATDGFNIPLTRHLHAAIKERRCSQPSRTQNLAVSAPFCRLDRDLGLWFRL